MLTSISVGTQLHAPQGYGALEAGVTYYLLWSIGRETVCLVHFTARAPKKTQRRRGKQVHTVSRRAQPVPHLLRMPRDIFEAAVLEEKLIPIDKPSHFPPWLSELDGRNLALIDACRHGAVKSHQERIDRQLEVIYPLVRDVASILKSPNPDLVINRHARSCKPRQNETRTRLAFYVYLVFGRNRYALHYPTHKIGHWCRQNHPGSVKRGRPSIRKGKEHGYNASKDLIEKAVDRYMRDRGPGVTMSAIYRTYMTKDLGCRGCLDRDGMYVFYHPDGREFMTKRMFTYHVLKAVGIENVQRSMYGYVRVRSKIDPFAGSFTHDVCNIMERTERDAYAVSELPRGLLEGHTLPPLYCVRSRDVASGLVLGIGFSQGGERSSAYRMELFCRAIGKVRFCALFGIEIEEWQWPSIGLSDWEVQDRGAGSTDGAVGRLVAHHPVIREMPPSYAGQSKAVVESSNPKTRTTDDAPSHVVSNKRTFELVRREIIRVIKDNDSINIGARIPPDLLDYVRKPSPLALYKELDRRGRNDSHRISFDEAVRSFLTKLPATLTRDGVLLNDQRFNSGQLRASGVLGRALAQRSLPVELYVLDACLRHVWMEVNHEVIQLDVQVPIRSNNEVMYLSLQEVNERAAWIKQRDGAFDEHRDALAAKVEREYELVTGKSWSGGTRIAGRPKRGSAAARKEAAETRAVMHGEEVE